MAETQRPSFFHAGFRLRELLHAALLNFKIDLVIGQGSAARIHPYGLNRFTCIATTTHEVDCAKQLREVFALVLRLRSYARPELEQIVQLIAETTKLSIPPVVSTWIVEACDRNPHQIEVLIQRLFRVGTNKITEKDATEALAVFGFSPSQDSCVANIDDVQQLSGIEFEKLISTLLQKMGFRAETTKASGDGGIDIVAILDKPVVGGAIRGPVQKACARHSGRRSHRQRILRSFFGRSEGGERNTHHDFRIHGTGKRVR